MGEVRQFPTHRSRLPEEANYAKALSVLGDAAGVLGEEPESGYQHLLPLLTRMLVQVHGAEAATDMLETAVLLAEALGRRGPAA